MGLAKARRYVIGLLETITVRGKNGSKRLTARIDTGATKSSIDSSLAEQLGLGPILRTRLIKSAHGASRRPVVLVSVRIAGKIIKDEFTLADRGHMKYKVLIGHNVLFHHPFLVDPHKKHKEKGRT